MIRFLSFLAVSNAFHFILENNEIKCFLEDLPADTQFSGKFVIKTPANDLSKEEQSRYIKGESGLTWKDPTAGSGLFVEVFSPGKNNVKKNNHKKIISRKFDETGKIVFTSMVSGDYKICLKLILEPGKNEIREAHQLSFAQIRLTLLVGEDFQWYKEEVSREQFSDLQLRVRMLLDGVKRISKSQHVHRQRQNDFRLTADKTNSSVFWWGIMQLGILIVAGCWQIKNLRRFFETKKLV